LSATEQAFVHRCDRVHGIGKIGFPEWLLEKAEPLVRNERRLIGEHPVVGTETLSKGVVAPELIHRIIHHHERLDGSGYPSGFVGCDIPLIGRIRVVTDAYDAMASNLPHRAALSHEISIERLTKGSRPVLNSSAQHCFQSICGCLESEGFSWSRVQLGGDRVELLLSECR
jgi:HD-GYP domain-containing protein (c-di-GMP phosphodiesterase class II)